MKLLKTLQWVWTLMLKRPWGLFLVISLFMGVTVCDILSPLLIRNFLATFEASPYSPEDSIAAATFMIVIGWVACYVFQFLGYQANNYYQTFGMAWIFKRLYDRIQYAPHFWHASELTGSSVVKITRSVKGYEVFTDRLYLSGGFLSTILVSIGTSIILGLSYPIVALTIGLCIVTGSMILILMTVYVTGPANRIANNEESTIGGTIADRIISNNTIKSFATEKIEKLTLSNLIDRWRVIEYKSWTKSHIAGLLYEMTIVIAFAFGAYFCIRYTQEGIMPLSDVAFVFFSINMINANARQLGRVILDMQKSLNDMEDAVAIDNIRAEESGKLILNSFEQKISLTGVTFQYPKKEKKVLDIQNLIIPKGQKLGILGPSGAGKSTLINLLTRFYDVNTGSIKIDEQILQDTNVQSLRKNIAVIPQDTILFHRSLKENIGYGFINPTMDEIICAAKKAFAHDFINELPQGYDTLVGERGVKLSGGQRQRIAIARAILKDAPILILDEATSALDSESEKFIQNSLRDLMQDKTVIAIAHRLSTIAHLDRLIVMEDGKIIEDGTHQQLLEKTGLYTKLWDMQSGGFLIEK